jgi:chemotaxis response regulator CheB
MIPASASSRLDTYLESSIENAHLHVVIVDAERLTRLALRTYLGESRTVGVVTECTDGLYALRVIGRVRPDCVS